MVDRTPNLSQRNLVQHGPCYVIDPVSFTSTHCYRQSFRDILVKTTARQISTLEAHRRLGKQTQRHRGVQSAEWRCNLSSKVSRLFLPVLFSAVRDVPLAFKKEGVGRQRKVSKLLYTAPPWFLNKVLPRPLRLQPTGQCQEQAALEFGFSFQKPSVPWGTILLKDWLLENCPEEKQPGFLAQRKGSHVCLLVLFTDAVSLKVFQVVNWDVNKVKWATTQVWKLTPKAALRRGEGTLAFTVPQWAIFRSLVAEPKNQLGGWAHTQPHLLGSPAGPTDSAVEGIPTSSVISALKSAPWRTASSGPYWSKKQPSLQHLESWVPLIVWRKLQDPSCR